jgi:hypothetical protein
MAATHAAEVDRRAVGRHDFPMSAEQVAVDPGPHGRASLKVERALTER